MTRPDTRSDLLWIALVGMIGCAILVFIFYHGESWQKWEWLKAVLIICSFFLFAVCSVWTIQYLIDYRTVALADYNRAKAITPQSEMLRQVKGLNPAMYELLRSLQLEWEVMLGEPGPLYNFRAGERKIPRSFVIEMLGDDKHLTPVGRYAEGTPERADAVYLTKLLAGFGLCTKGIEEGPHSASWINRPRALQMLGLEHV